MGCNKRLQAERIGLTKYSELNKMNMKIIDYQGSTRLTVEFEDGAIEQNRAWHSWCDDSIKNNNVISVYGVGYIGYGPYKPFKNGKMTKGYSVWTGIISRVYNQHALKLHPAYKGCSVVPEWHNYQNFAEWYYSNLPSDEGDFEVDKDLLYKGNRIYGPNQCTIIPGEINREMVLSSNRRGKYPIGIYWRESRQRFIVKIGKKNIGETKTIEEGFAIYKKAKEKRYKQLAEKYKSVLSHQAYEALTTRTIEFDD